MPALAVVLRDDVVARMSPRETVHGGADAGQQLRKEPTVSPASRAFAQVVAAVRTTLAVGRPATCTVEWSIEYPPIYWVDGATVAVVIPNDPAEAEHS